MSMADVLRGSPLPTELEIVPNVEAQNANYLLLQPPSHIEHESINKAANQAYTSQSLK